MFKRKLAFFATAVLITIILAATLIPQTLAAVDPNSYTVEVRYYDAMKNTYTITKPGGAPDSLTEDVPVGGLRRSGSTNDYIISQVYCIDPFVPFAGRTDESGWDGTTNPNNGYTAIWDKWSDGGFPATEFNDWGVYRNNGEVWGGATRRIKGGYYPAAPWTSSSAVQKHSEAIFWLVYNGYRGDFRNSVAPSSESYESLERLNTMYPDIALLGGVKGIDKTVATMATKVALWKVVTGNNGSVILEDTALSIRPEWKEMYFKLVDALAEDATEKKYPTGSLPTGDNTKLSLKIKDGFQPMAGPMSSDSEFLYYGPLTVEAVLNKPADESEADLKKMDGIFLTIDGQALTNVTLVNAPSSSGTALPSGVVPGTNKPAQRIAGEYKLTDKVWVSNQFYLKVPKSRVNISGISSAYAKLTVKAMAKAAGILVKEGTPVILVYQYPEGHAKAGVQDWDAVQAFVGAAKVNQRIDLFAEDSFTTSTTLGELYIYKRVEADEPEDVAEEEFLFQIYYLQTNDAPPDNYPPTGARVLNLTEHTVHGLESAQISLSENSFTLKNSELAYIQDLPIDGYYYWIVELDVDKDSFSEPPRFAIPFQKGAAIAKTGCFEEEYEPDKYNYWTPAFQIDNDEDILLAFVTFYNTIEKTEVAHIHVYKFVPKPPIGFPIQDIVRNKEFTFKLERFIGNDYSVDSPDEDWEPVLLSIDNFVCIGSSSDDAIVDGEKGMFKLRSYQQAVIDVKSGEIYRVLELGAEGALQGWWTVYGVYIYDSSVEGWVGEESDDYYRHPESVATPGYETEEDETYFFTFVNQDVYDLTITKTVTGNGTNADDFNRSYKFIVFRNEGPSPRASPLSGQETDTQTPEEGGMTFIPLSADGGWQNGILTWKVEIPGVDNADDRIDKAGGWPIILNLYHGETAIIHDLFSGYYRVIEWFDGKEGERYSTTYKIGNTVKDGQETVDIPLADDSRVDFTNTVNRRPNIPHEPEEPEEPEEPDEPGKPEEPGEPEEPEEPGKPNVPDEPDKPNIPEIPETPIDPNEPPTGGNNPKTGDDYDPLGAIITIVLGLGCLTTAVYIRRRKPTAGN